MNYELIKNEFIKIKKEELEYIEEISKISSNKVLSEYEKIEIYRTLKKLEERITEILKILYKEVFKNKKLTLENESEVIVEFDLDENYLKSVNFYHEQQKKYVLNKLGIDIETLKFKLTLSKLSYNLRRSSYRTIEPDIIQNNQKLIDDSIYIFKGYYDESDDCYGFCFGNPEDYIFGTYENICKKDNYQMYVRNIRKSKICDFEKDKMIIHSGEYVSSDEIRKIFNEELLNIQNKTIKECFIKTEIKVKKLNYTRSPEYKEKVLLNKINELYKKVKGKFIEKEILYSGQFLEILSETYKLPNEKIVKKEKIVKNGGKNSVIVIPITEDKEYIITFQNRIKDKIIAEFPSGYIENNEDPIETAKRELKEETGYITDELFIVDEAYTSPGIDNSATYIVLANNCIKTNEKSINGTELVSYGLFKEKELHYLINNNIMNGAMNKLAYYNLVNNLDDFSFIGSKTIHKRLRKKANPLADK